MTTKAPEGTETAEVVEKLLLALEDASPAARDDFVAWTRKVSVRDRIERAEVEELSEDAQRAHTAKPVRFFAFASFWLPPDDADAVLTDAPAPIQWFRVRERLAFDRSGRPDEARPWAGVKKTTLWAPVAGVRTHVWQARYTNHGQIAKAYHATCVRYRQNIVVEGSVPELRAISELWWTNLEDLVERFYVSSEAEQLVAVDTMGFVDARRAHPTVTTHETLRVGRSFDSERGFR